MAETNLINRIAIHAVASSALPTLAAKGANIAKSAWTTATYKTLGSVARHSDDADITDDSVDVTISRAVEEIMQTRGLQREDLILLQNRVEEFSVVAEDVGETLMALASDMAVTDHVTDYTAALTYRSVAIEINGLRLDWYPKCAVFIDAESAGYGTDGKAKTTFIFLPVATTAAPSGRLRYHYEAA